MRAAIHYLFAVAALSLYGGQVCPFIDSLSTGYWFLFLGAVFAAAFALRRAAFPRYVQSAPSELKTGRALALDLSLFLAVALFVTLFNFGVHHFPFGSGVKLMLGCLTLGFFAAIDAALEEERLVLKDSEGGGSFTVSPRFIPLTLKFFTVAAITVVLLLGIVFLIFARDLEWLYSARTVPFTQARIVILTEIVFLSVVILGEILNLLMGYSRNLRLLFAYQNRALMAAAEGDYQARVPVGTNDEFGLMARYTNLMVDELKRRTAEKTAAEEATQLKDKFVALVAHDLRSPFNSLLGYLKLVSNDTQPPPAPRHKELVEKAINGGQTLVDTIDQLLNITRLQTGKLKPEPKFIGARELAAQTLDRIGYLAEKKGITVENSLPPEMRLYADPALAAEVLGNLFSNAIKFCGKGDRITVSADPAKPGAITVSDTGKGIPAAFIGDLFRHEIKTSTPGTEGEKGTGLGLPLCHDIMAAHGGDLTAESVEGHGAAFHIFFPPVTPSALVAVADPAARTAAVAALERMGVAVRTAMAAADAQVMLDEALPHLLLLDFDSADVNGAALLERLRADARTAQLPVLVLTARDTPEVRQKAFGLRVGGVAALRNADEIARKARRFLG